MAMEMIDSIRQGVIAETADYWVRTLCPADPNEYETRAADFPHYPNGIPDPSGAVVVIVEHKASGKIVASWQLITCPFLEGLWVAPEHRGLQGAIHQLLLGGMFSLMASMGVSHPLTLAQDDAILLLARKAGFTPVAGTLLKLE